MRFRTNRNVWDWVREYSRMQKRHSSDWIDEAVRMLQSGELEDVEVDKRCLGGGEVIGHCKVKADCETVRTAIKLRVSKMLRDWPYKYTKDLLDTILEIEAFKGRQIDYRIAEKIMDKKIEARIAEFGQLPPMPETYLHNPNDKRWDNMKGNNDGQ